jgi:ribonuclease P protein component
MLPRNQRLQRQQDVSATMRYGQRLSTPYVNIYARPSHLSHSRSACVVGRKVDHSAVGRHRIQRWLREIASSTLSGMPRQYDVVWVARPGAATVRSKEELARSVEPQLKQLLTAG